MKYMLDITTKVTPSILTLKDNSESVIDQFQNLILRY